MLEKLASDFFDKDKNILHYQNLQLYLGLVLKLKNNRILEFNQSQWLKFYRKLNTRKNANTKKYAIYGKTMENLRNIINVKRQNNEKYCLKCTSRPSYTSYKISENNLVAISKSKLALKLNEPAYIGMCILELGKVLMYDFHYDYINKNKYDNKSKLSFHIN